MKILGIIAILLLIISGCNVYDSNCAVDCAEYGYGESIDDKVSEAPSDDSTDGTDTGDTPVDTDAQGTDEPGVPPVDISEITSLYRVEVNETELVKINLRAVDPDGDQITFTYSSPFNSSGEWQTKEGDEGEYSISVIASDGISETQQDVMIVVTALNNAPVIGNFEDIKIDEGDLIQLNPTVTDADGDSVSIEYSGFMDSNEYQTTFNDAGDYKVTLKINDGKRTVMKTIDIIIVDINRIPVIGSIGDISFTEGDLVEIVPIVTDPDGDAVSISFSEPLDAAGKWQTKDGDEGEYSISVFASDGISKTQQDIVIDVTALNNAPVISNFEDIKANEGDLIQLNPTVTDADGDSVSIKYSGFMDSNEYQTTFDDAGEYEVTLETNDGKKTVMSTIDIVIVDINRKPVIESIEDISITEGDLVEVVPSVSDPDGDAVSISFSDPLDASGKWQTEIGDSGAYSVLIEVTDGKLSASTSVKLNVLASNKNPEISIEAVISFKEGDLIELEPGRTDADGESITIV